MALFNLPQPRKVKPTPMLVLGAENDTIFTRAEEKATVRAYTAQAEFFPNMAHDMMLEAGWQKVAERIVAWLKEKGL
jgi:alpha-beta hydrolase superfamily lysophospholipase